MQEIASKITDSELEVLKVLWTAGSPLPIGPIRKELQESRGWDGSTVKTLLRRLCEKGAVEAKKKEVFYYFPLLKREEYQYWSTQSLIQKVYRGSARALVASLVRGDQLTEEDLEELKSLLDKGGCHD